PASIQADCRPARISMAILALLNAATASASHSPHNLIEAKVRGFRAKLQIELFVPGAVELSCPSVARLIFREHGGDATLAHTASGSRLIATLPGAPSLTGR